MDFKVTIIGAGVVGLAIAENLSKRFSHIIILEKNKTFGLETSSRNSEVIHSGIYYPLNSLKAKLCVIGKKMLFEYCENHQINYKKCGKLVIANTIEEKKKLQSILNQARNNGVKDGRIIFKDEIQDLESNITAVEAIHFPSSGIIDGFGLMKNLAADSEKNGVEFAYGQNVSGLKKIDKGYCITATDHFGNDFEFTSEIVINSSGLEAFNISSKIGLNASENRIHYWKGEYFSIGNGKGKLVNSLIYPVPNKNITGLGIHFTKDLGNRARLGPNAIFLKNNKLDYSVLGNNKKIFYDSAVKFLPFLELNDLNEDQAGIRPKLQKPGDPFRDFIIRNENDIGYKNFINLLGIESPGLTSCLAIAEHVNKSLLD